MAFINRRFSHSVRVDGKVIGGSAPILVQSMTNTSSEDFLATAKQVKELFEAGSELVRITVNTREAAQAVPRIFEQLEKWNALVPIIGDFHYNGHLLLADYPECARLLGKYRINPGNVGRGEKHDDNFQRIIEIALKWHKPVRIGVNWGSLDLDLLQRMMDDNATLKNPKTARDVLTDAIVESALRSATLAEAYGMRKDQIVISAKVSEVPDLVEVYRRLAGRSNYALHLGLTEAGMGVKGIVSSSSALAILLAEGIGDTIRVSLTPGPNTKRTKEVEICQNILQSLGIRSFAPQVTACPGCGRTTSTLFQDMAQEIQDYLAEHRPVWQDKYAGVEELKVAVMGCIVNGPGESKHANIGISLPGTDEEPRAPVYIDGAHITTLSGARLVKDFIAILNDYVERRYGCLSSRGL